ncbi:MAG: hypothetical protein OHK0019_35460 [Saprospiraceae bacterium]
MKKLIFLVFSLALFATTLFSQQISIGPRVGYTLSDLKFIFPDELREINPNEHSEPLSSFHAGVDASMSLSDRFGIVASLLYARKGYAGEEQWPTGPEATNWELHYFNLPILADFRVWKGLSLQGGTELGRLLSARLKSSDKNAYVKDFFEKFDLGLVAGLEYRLNNGFFISARHVFGIYSIQTLEVTDDTGNVRGNLKTRNTATQFSVGYRYAFSR